MHPHKDLGNARRIYSWLPHSGFKAHHRALFSMYIQLTAQSELVQFNTPDVQARIATMKRAAKAGKKAAKEAEKARANAAKEAEKAKAKAAKEAEKAAKKATKEALILKAEMPQR